MSNPTRKNVRAVLADGGVAVKARLDGPSGVAEDVAGDLFLADAANNQIREVAMPTTINDDLITTVAGKAAAGFSGDGGPAAKARLDDPRGVAVDGRGDVYIADTGNNRVREINSSGMIVTVAGNGACGSDIALSNNGPAGQASLCDPTGLAVDAQGDVYIADTGHNLVREVAPVGTITTFAGNGDQGTAGNGGKAKKAELDAPAGVVVDAIGDVYIADSGNNQVRVVNPKGVINLFAGTGTAGHSGDGGLAVDAKLSDPTGIGIDPSGDVFITDTGSNRIREVSADGMITTYAGTGKNGHSGDGGPAASAKLSAPTGSTAADGAAVYFSDTANQRVRGVFAGPPPVLPETATVILLPLSVVLIGGAGYLILRRRQRSSTTV